MAQRPRGTRDFAPDETAARRAAAKRLRGVFERFGYREVQTPTFEELDLFTAKSGEGIVAELYDFMDKAGRKMTLRPELTAPTMRMYFQEHAFDPKPVKWYYFGNCFRYDRPQAGRYREFWQFGCEQIGAGTPLAYAELIALVAALFDEVGLRQQEIRVGHVAILRALVDELGVEGETRGKTMRAIDKRDDEGLRALLRDEGSPDEAVARLFAAMDAPDVEAARAVVGDQAGFAELEATFRHLRSFGAAVRLDLGIARGLDYYTSIVFEAHSTDPEMGAERQLLGGGGYDLSAVFEANPTPTMGFGLGFDRLLVALGKEGHPPEPVGGPALYLGALSDAAVPVVVEAATALRRDGITVDMDLLGRKAGQIAKHADAIGAAHLVLVGERDIEAGKVRVKRLATGESDEVALDRLKDWRP